EEALRVVALAEGERFLGEAAHDLERRGGRAPAGLVVDERRRELHRLRGGATRARQRRAAACAAIRASGVRRAAFGAMNGDGLDGAGAVLIQIHERERLIADGDAREVLQGLGARDATSIDVHAVAAPEVLDDDGVRRHGEARVPPRDAGVLEREMALRAPADDELSLRELEICGAIAKSI